MVQKLKQNNGGRLYLLGVLMIMSVLIFAIHTERKVLAQNSTEREITRLAEDITLNIVNEEINLKDIIQLKVCGLPNGGKCQWYSNREDVAYVTAKGKVTAKKAGKATITCNVLVKEKRIKTLKAVILVKNPKVESLKLNEETITLEDKKSRKLSASVSPKIAENPKVYWESGNAAIAAVSSTGNVTAVSEGTTYIRAYTENGKSVICGVIVNPKKEEPPKIEKVDFTVMGDFIVGETKGTIEFQLSKRAADVFIEILNEENQCVRTISMGSCQQSINRCSWDGKGENGNPVKDGSYSIRVNADGRTKKSKKLKVYEKGDFAKGNGTAENPYRVSNHKELDKVRNHHGKYFKQTNDIDMLGTYFKPLFSSRKKFSGMYDGGGYKIMNLTVDNGTSGYAGLFAAIGEDGTVQKVHVSNCNIIGGKYTAAIAGKNNGTIIECSVSGWIHGTDYAAGICGFNEGTVRECKAAAIVTGDKVGGILIEKY